MNLGLEQTSVLPHQELAAQARSSLCNTTRIQSLYPYLQVAWDTFHTRAPIPFFDDHQCSKWGQSNIWFKKRIPDLD